MEVKRVEGDLRQNWYLDKGEMYGRDEEMKDNGQPRLLSQIHGERCWPQVDKLSPCEEACPLHSDVPSYVIAIAQGKFAEALEVIRQTNPFPSICGRVCHHPCEAECNRGLVDEPIANQWLKRFVADYGLAHYERPEPLERTRREKVAIIGSGPAGLTAAYDLVRAGYGVSVYEALPVAGGMLTAGIPSFVLPREIIEAEIDYIKALGVKIKTGIKIGEDLSLEELREQGYAAILLASGAQRSARLPIAGVELPGVYYALPLLRQVNLSGGVEFKGRVVVIGGGAVALDAARVAKRLGAEEVVVMCLEAREDMPAFSWLIDAAEGEGVKIEARRAPQRIAERAGGKGLEIEYRKVATTWLDEEGRISWKLEEGEGSEGRIEADSVVIAIGQGVEVGYAEESRVKVSGRGAFAVDEETLATNVEGIFAAGDAVVVRGTVVEAIAAGHEAAESIDRYLRGEDLKAGRRGERKEVLKIDPKERSGWLTLKSRWEMPVLSSKDAVRSFNEVELGYTQAQAVEEAKRCLNCRMCVNCIYGRGQICFETGSRLL